MAQEPGRPPDSSEQDDLFGKLDELIGKRQGRPPRRRLEPPVPTLTEAVSAAPHQLEIPVLDEVVEIPSPPGGEAAVAGAADRPPPLIDKRKQLQVALYLRLRQRVDQELQAVLAAHGTSAGSALDQSLARLARELRSALPAIVREAVDQVFASDQGDEDPKL
jgi:hypothetical protein